MVLLQLLDAAFLFSVALLGRRALANHFAARRFRALVLTDNLFFDLAITIRRQFRARGLQNWRTFFTIRFTTMFNATVGVVNRAVSFAAPVVWHFLKNTFVVCAIFAVVFWTGE